MAGILFASTVVAAAAEFALNLAVRSRGKPRICLLPKRSAVDQQAHKGAIWSATFQDKAVKIDPQTGKNIFQNGILKLDLQTGKYSFYPLITGKDTYGVAVDREGNGWYSSPGSDRVDVADAQTGKTAEIVFQPTGPESGMEITDQDRVNSSPVR